MGIVKYCVQVRTGTAGGVGFVLTHSTPRVLMIPRSSTDPLPEGTKVVCLADPRGRLAGRDGQFLWIAVEGDVLQDLAVVTAAEPYPEEGAA